MTPPSFRSLYDKGVKVLKISIISKPMFLTKKLSGNNTTKGCKIAAFFYFMRMNDPVYRNVSV